MRPLWLAPVAALLLIAAACGGGRGAPTPPATAPPATAPRATATGIAANAASPTPGATVAQQRTATASADATAPALSATATPAAGGVSVTVSAVGDVSLGRQVNEWMAQYGAGYPYELVRPLLSGDIVFGNLEGALTEQAEPWPKAFNFRTPPGFASGLAAAGFDVVALANNHAMDFGLAGLADTRVALERAAVLYAGAGDGGMSARRAAIVEANGIRVGFVACVLTPAEGTGFTIDAWAAGEGPGLFVCSPYEIELSVAEARAAGAEFVLLSMHAGDEYVNAPNSTQQSIAGAALAAGADVVLGHHAHVVQPVEQRGDQLIVWGMGNFIFDLDEWDLAGIPEPRVAPVLQITLTRGAGVTGWRADAVVLDAEADRPRPATPQEAAALGALLTP